MTGGRNNGIALLAVFTLLAWTAAPFANFRGEVVAVKDGGTFGTSHISPCQEKKW